jgi:hypothetical protein
MTTHIYAFGSVCRGEISQGSDVDILALVSSRYGRFDPDTYSIYSYERIGALWDGGNPFAWHLALESRLLYASDKTDHLKQLGEPKPYRKCAEDCRKFRNLYLSGIAAVKAGEGSAIFDLSMIFLSIRNIATCYSLGVTGTPTFSRRSALQLGSASVPLSEKCYRILERARILCTRGYGMGLTEDDITFAVHMLEPVEKWMTYLVEGAQCHERVQ